MLKWFMLLLYLALISYLLWRIVHWFQNVHPLVNKKRIIIPVVIIFILVCSTLLLGGLLPKSPLQRTLRIFSNYWLAFFIFLTTYTLIQDILLLIFLLIDRKVHVPLMRKKRGYALIGSIVITLTVTSTVYGLYHAKKIYINTYETQVEKSAGDTEELNVVLLGDLHLGYSVGCEVIEDMVNKVNSLNADIIVIAGDIYDNDFDALDDPDRLAELLREMKSTYGTYAVYGNHDVDELLIGGFPTGSGEHSFRDPRLVDFVKAAGFTMLEDESVLINDSFYLVGRVDLERDGHGTKIHKNIGELTADLDMNKPVIALAHEPKEFDKAEAAGVDLMMCGHTHAGQFFPLTIVQPFAFENYWGYKKIDNLGTYVTSGVGIYGPDVRLGTDAEIMQVKIRFK